MAFRNTSDLPRLGLAERQQLYQKLRSNLGYSLAEMSNPPIATSMLDPMPDLSFELSDKTLAEQAESSPLDLPSFVEEKRAPSRAPVVHVVITTQEQDIDGTLVCPTGPQSINVLTAEVEKATRFYQAAWKEVRFQFG